MAYNIQESWIRSGSDKEAVDTVLRRESDQDARRLGLLTHELRHQAAAVEGNRRNAREALTELVPPESEQIARLSEQEGLQGDAPRVGISAGNDSRLQLEHAYQANDNRSAAARQQQPVEWAHSLTKTIIADAGGGKGFSQEESAQLLATLIRQTKPDAGLSIPTDDVLGQYAKTLPVTPPESLYTGPLIGMEQAGDMIYQQARTGVEFPETWGAVPGAVETREGRGGDEGEFRFAATLERGPVNRRPSLFMAQQEAAAELTMSQAFTRDRTLGERAIGAALSGFPEAVGPGDRRPPASNAQTMIEPNCGSERHLSQLANTSTTGLGKEMMVAATQELERLRSAARRTADELEKVRGPVPPAFPARPPVFRDRS